MTKPGDSSFFVLLSNWNEINERLEGKEITRGEYDDIKDKCEGNHWMDLDDKSPWAGRQELCAQKSTVLLKPAFEISFQAKVNALKELAMKAKSLSTSPLSKC